MITYASQDELGNPIEVSITREEAIIAQRKAAATYEHIYDSDEEALNDFMTVHWAWETTRR